MVLKKLLELKAIKRVANILAVLGLLFCAFAFGDTITILLVVIALLVIAGVLVTKAFIQLSFETDYPKEMEQVDREVMTALQRLN